MGDFSYMSKSKAELMQMRTELSARYAEYKAGGAKLGAEGVAVASGSAASASMLLRRSSVAESCGNEAKRRDTNARAVSMRFRSTKFFVSAAKPKPCTICSGAVRANVTSSSSDSTCQKLNAP